MTESSPPTDTAPAPSPAEGLTFAAMGLDERVLQALADVGYESPSPIQAATIPPLLAGRSVVGLAQTGTGKTAAFALPLLSRIDLDQRAPQALVLAPTRELALQVADAFARYAAHLPGLHVLPVYGGSSYTPQLAALKRGVHVVVGTPGRVIDHLARKTLDLSQLTYLVLDEADEMLQMGFAEDVETILAETPADKQVALFSATMPAQIRRMAQKYLNDPQEITVKSKTATTANTTQRYLEVAWPAKLDALTRILEVEEFDGMIVFVRTKQATEELAERLRSRGYSAAAINGDLQQAQRERTIEQLKSGAVDILVATDVAARGLDVDRISHVVNYDIPLDAESYVHRVGRTGRAGRTGAALLFVTPRERRLLAAIERTTRQPITEMSLPSVEDVNASRKAGFADSITAALGDDQLGLFRTLVLEYAQTHDVPLADVAAALAVQSREGSTFLLAPDPPRAERAERRVERDSKPGRKHAVREDRHAADKAPRVAGRKPAGNSRSGVQMATYSIRVGRRHKVQPGQIVGALANEGGLSRADFGHIDIQADHTLVELPARLEPSTWSALKRTRISGQLIELSHDDSAAGARRDKPRHRPAKP